MFGSRPSSTSVIKRRKFLEETDGRTRNAGGLGPVGIRVLRKKAQVFVSITLGLYRHRRVDDKTPIETTKHDMPHANHIKGKH